MKKWFTKKEDQFEEVEDINLFQIKTKNYTIQKYNDIFYIKNNDTGYIEEVDNLHIKIK